VQQCTVLLVPALAAGDLSRNRTVGVRIGQGEALADITASMGGAVAEVRKP
jgi:glycerol-3-phosphate dehydrogenase